MKAYIPAEACTLTWALQKGLLAAQTGSAKSPSREMEEEFAFHIGGVAMDLAHYMDKRLKEKLGLRGKASFYKEVVSIGEDLFVQMNSRAAGWNYASWLETRLTERFNEWLYETEEAFA